MKLDLKINVIGMQSDENKNTRKLWITEQKTSFLSNLYRIFIFTGHSDYEHGQNLKIFVGKKSTQ